MEITKEILELRPYLFSIAYNMLGVIEEAEDIVQDIYVKWISAENVREPKAYLGRIAVNQAINRLNELKKLRESYVGTWLPEPYITLEPEAVPTLEYGMLFLLEKLNPVERAVFILRESFSEEYGKIAELTGLSAENCRQLLHRSREKIGRSKTITVDPLKQRELAESFLSALHQQNRTALDELLRSDIALYSDGGGKRAAALKPLFGQEKVLKFLLGVAGLPESQDGTFEPCVAFVNGMPAMLLIRKSTGEIDSAQYLVMDERGISHVMFVRNPDKLRVRN